MGIEELPKFNPVSDIQKGDLKKIAPSQSPLPLPSSSKIREELNLNNDDRASADLKSSVKKVRDALADGSGRNIPPGAAQAIRLTPFTHPEGVVPASKTLIKAVNTSDEKYTLGNIISALLSLSFLENPNIDKN